MQEKPKSGVNLLIVAAIVIAIGVGGYLYIQRGANAPEPTLTTIPTIGGMGATTGGTADVSGNLLVQALRDLKTHNLDSSLFKDPLWLSLTDYSKELAPQEAFRVNPFAPLNVPVSQGTSSVQIVR